MASHSTVVKRRRTVIVAGIVVALVTGIAMCGSDPAPQSQSAIGRGGEARQQQQQAQNPFATHIPKFGQAPEPVRATLPDNGDMAPVLRRVPTEQPVAFITIDDGNVRHGDAPTLLAAPHTPASAFLISRIASLDPGYFQQLQADGMPIQAHSISHTNLRGQSYTKQAAEICGSADELAGMFGTRPTLFRPPYGEYDNTTLRAAKDCGMKAVLYWSESVVDGHVYYQTPEKKVQPGDILLLHFRDAIVSDILAALQAIYDSGLTPALLEDYIG